MNDENTDKNEPILANGSHNFKRVFEAFFTQLESMEEISPVLALVAAGYMKEVLEEHLYFVRQYSTEDNRINIPDDKVLELLRSAHDAQKTSKVLTVTFNSLFIGVFALFDGFVNDLLLYIMSQRPDINLIEDRDVRLYEVLKHATMDDFRRDLVERAISSVLRDNYSEQLKRFSTLFSMKIDPPQCWSAFIECSQRRNIIVHNGGKVTEQYISNCEKSNVHWEQGKPKIGEHLMIDKKYLLNTIEIVHEIALKLGTAVARKVVKSCLEDSDSFLGNHLYRLLEREQWAQARMVGEYASNLPNYSDSEAKRRIAVNYAQALKWSGDKDGCTQVLSRFDWSDVSEAFVIAKCALEDDYDNIWKHVSQSGCKDKWKINLREWPLFRELRATAEFSKNYAEVFEESYGVAVVQDASSNDYDKAIKAMRGLFDIYQQGKDKASKGRKSQKRQSTGVKKI